VKLIISRKGFDSSAGGVASPILPDGRLRSLPIPDRESPLRYRDISSAAPTTASLVSALSPRTRPAHGVHLDPDLDATSRSRAADWRPAFGQAGAALSHLRNHEVGVGDLFLFFGWFRAVDRVGRGWRFQPGAPDLHIPGAGVWPDVSARRVLTAPGRSRSHWKLPRTFAPISHDAGLDCLSYHTQPARWRVEPDHCELQVTPRGQEFVLDLARRPGVSNWIRAVFDDCDRAAG